MLHVEPPRSEGDVRFRIGDIPVRIHPFYWLAIVLLRIGGGNKTRPLELVIWLAAVTFSILLHELGHAWMQRRCGGRPRITLYALGGLASSDQGARSASERIQISLAGPAAGFVFAAGLALLLAATGHQVGWLTPWTSEPLSLLVGPVDGLGVLGTDLYWESPRWPAVAVLVYDLFFANVYWGLVNLLPIFPLDGGQVARELLQLSAGVSRGAAQSLALSAVVGAAMALYGLSNGSFYTFLLFAYLAYQSYQTWNLYHGRRL